MSELKFINWLQYEVSTVRCALLTLYEEKDRLLYIECPKLEAQYMENIGHFEEQVIREEIEHELILKKQNLVQAALNRRGPVDMQSIEAAIDAERQMLMKEAAGSNYTNLGFHSLPEEQMSELQQLYHDITYKYHPQTHSGLTAVQKELYQRAQDAYRRKDLEALRLINTMLKSAENAIADSAMSASISITAGVTVTDGKSSGFTIGDYSLAATLFSSFVPLDEEAIFYETLINYQNQVKENTEKLEQIKTMFPFSAAEMLSDPEQLKAYKAELEQRLTTARQQIEQRSQLIQRMIQEAR